MPAPEDRTTSSMATSELTTTGQPTAMASATAIPKLSSADGSTKQADCWRSDLFRGPPRAPGKEMRSARPASLMTGRRSCAIPSSSGPAITRWARGNTAAVPLNEFHQQRHSLLGRDPTKKGDELCVHTARVGVIEVGGSGCAQLFGRNPDWNHTCWYRIAKCAYGELFAPGCAQHRPSSPDDRVFDHGVVEVFSPPLVSTVPRNLDCHGPVGRRGSCVIGRRRPRLSHESGRDSEYGGGRNPMPDQVNPRASTRR